MNLTPILRVPIKQGRKPKLYDCGRHGKLSGAMIAKMAGISQSAVYRRIRLGAKGEELVQPRHESSRKPRRIISRGTMVAAARLVRAFPDRVPSLNEIIAVQPMSVRTAQRWRQVLTQTLAERNANMASPDRNPAKKRHGVGRALSGARPLPFPAQVTTQ